MHCFVFASGSYIHGIFMYHKWQQLEVLHLELSLQLFWFLVICNITDWAESWLSFIFCWKLLNTVNIGFYIWNWERSSFLLKKTSSQFPSFETRGINCVKPQRIKYLKCNCDELCTTTIFCFKTSLCLIAKCTCVATEL